MLLNKGLSWSTAIMVAALIFSACPIAALAAGNSPSIEVGYSPEGSATALVMKAIGAARTSIRMMAYSFSDPDIMQALANAHKQGVDVQIVIDAKANRNRASLAAMNFIVNAGIPLRTDDAFGIQHDKVIIVDGQSVETGSYNYSRAAAGGFW